MASYHLSIITPQGKFFDQDVESLTAPGSEGTFGVLANHTPIVSLLKKGTLKVDQKSFQIGPGILEVNSEHQVLVLLDSIGPENIPPNH